MDKTSEHALALLRKADEDLYAATCLSRAEGASLWTVGFHAQQAVEKSLKAVLMSRSVRYPFTHDIEALIKLVRQSGLLLPPDSNDLPFVTPFGTLFRYEDIEEDLPDSVDSVRLLAWAETTVVWARTIIEEPKQRDISGQTDEEHDDG